MRKEVPLHRLGKPQNQNCKGLASGRRCQIRTASLVPKTSVLPLHHILYGVAMRPRLRSQYRSDLSGDAQISLNTALEQLSFNRWLWVGHWGQRPDLNWNFEGMNLVCFHYTTLRYVRHFVRMPQTGQKRIGGSKMPYLVLGWDGWIRTSECGSQSPMPCRLATPQYNAAGAAWCWRWDSNPHGFPCDFESQLSASSSTPTYPPTISITILCILLSKSLVSILGRKTSETSPEQLSFSLFLYYHNYAYLSIAFLGFCESFFRTHKSASTPS